jgi:hypothetical protein
MQRSDAVLRTSCDDASPRAATGASDAELVTAIIAGAALCIECIGKRTGMPSPHVDTMLARIAMTVKLSVQARRCSACLEDKMVFTLYRAPDPSPRPARRSASHTDALWLFLRNHRGLVFCTRCLATAIGATARIDRAVMDAEGRGAQRRYDRCSTCGRDRLVCGLKT